MNPLIIPAATAAIGFMGGERASSLDRREAARNRDFQAGQAGINRGFQERMRNTEWQAAVSDMKAAGINPAVAYSRGGASSPGGSMPGGATAAPARDSVASAQQSLMFKKNMELLTQQIDKTRGEASAVSSDANIKFVDQQMANARYQYYFGQNGVPTPALKQLLDSEFSSSLASSARSVSDAELSRLSIPERKAVASMFETLGASPKMLQVAMPFILQLMRGPR